MNKITEYPETLADDFFLKRLLTHKVQEIRTLAKNLLEEQIVLKLIYYNDDPISEKLWIILIIFESENLSIDCFFNPLRRTTWDLEFYEKTLKGEKRLTKFSIQNDSFFNLLKLCNDLDSFRDLHIFLSRWASGKG